MSSYDIKEILKDFTYRNFEHEISFDDFKKYYERHEKLSKPDFFAVIDLKKDDPVIFQKNYNLKFAPGQQEVLTEIIEAADPAQVMSILEVDKLSVDFVEKNVRTVKYAIFQLRFTASLINDEPRTFLRNISFINFKYLDGFNTLLFTTISDVTDLLGVKKNPKMNIKFTSNGDEVLLKKVMEFKKVLNNKLDLNLHITKREQQILNLIALGRTSEEIAEKLEISVKTVSTHRQNLIKKFKVKNTSALINFI